MIWATTTAFVWIHSVIHHTKAVRHWLQHRSGNSNDGTGAKLYWLLPFPWITPVTWRGGTCSMGISLSSIPPLPRHQGRGEGGPAAWTTTGRFPYHPCPGLRPGETFQGVDPWPLVTDGCHTHRSTMLTNNNFVMTALSSHELVGNLNFLSPQDSQTRVTSKTMQF